jgi:hypothetical protein
LVRVAKYIYISNKNPFTPPLDELVQKHPDVSKDETTDVEAKEFGGVASAQLETYLGLVCVSKTRVLNLTCDLI